MIQTSGLTKRFAGLLAVDGVDLDIPQGQIFGLLGHNGAGKTTVIRMLSTLSPLTSGRAVVAGVDVQEDPAEVRRRISVTGQFAALDEHLTGYENLLMIGRLLGLSRGAARARARDLLHAVDLEGAAGRKIKSYSGGMMRRIDLAASMVSPPEVLFLDEPTTGLDPVSRGNMWELVASMARNGSTILLTTQYLDEADHLADRIAVMSAGEIVAAGTPANLKASIGGRLVIVRDLSGDMDARVRRRLGPMATPAGRGEVRVPVQELDEVSRVITELHECGVGADQVEVQAPSLDEVFRALVERPDHLRSTVERQNA